MLARGYLSGIYFPVDSRLLFSELRPRFLGLAAALVS